MSVARLFFLFILSFGAAQTLWAAASLEKLTIGWSAIAGSQAPFWITKEAGLFEKNGLDVIMIYLDGGSTASIAVHETFEGKTVWKGIVEVFSLADHQTAKNAYAWSYENDTGKMRHVAVLEVPPINSPVDAVRASIVAESKSVKKGQ